MNGFWVNFVEKCDFNEEIIPCDMYGAKKFYFIIKEVPFIYYSLSMRKADFILALDVEHELLLKTYEPYMDLLSRLYPYTFLKTPTKVTIYKICNHYQLFPEFKKLVELTQEKVKFIYDTEISKNDVSTGSFQATFNDIYKKSIWGYGSGTGSNQNFLKPYIDWLQGFIDVHDVKSIVDCGCGDWQYMKNVNLSGIVYKGYDVSDQIVAMDRLNYQKDNVEFIQYNGDFDVLPKADLLICKEVLQHLPTKDVLNFIKIIKNYKYCILSNCIDVDDKRNNVGDIPRGSFRTIDLTKAPFNVDLKTVMDLAKSPTVNIRIGLVESKVA